MEKIGYARVSAAGVELQAFGDTKGQLAPPPVWLVLDNGDQVAGFKVGDVFADGSKFVERWLDDNPPAGLYTLAGRSIFFDGEKIIVTAQYTVRQPSENELAAYAAAVRYDKEVAGVPWRDGLVIQTDRESQGKMLSEFVAIGAGLRPDPSPWKFADNKFATISNADMISVCIAGRAHVAEAFASEDTVQAEITAGTFTTFSQIDTAFQ